MVYVRWGNVPGDWRLIDRLTTTTATVFPSIHIMDIPGTLNTMIFATKQPTTPENFATNLSLLSQQPGIHFQLISAMQITFANLKPGHETTQVFTDNRAPIEWIINNMVIRFALSGRLNRIKQ